jgi:hypothetical protein
MPLVAIPLAYWAVGGLIVATGATIAWQQSDGPQKTAEALNSLAHSMQGADEEANTQSQTAPIADTCTGNCPPPPGCKDREDGMRKDAETIKRRINEMKLDERDLYNNHYYEWQAHPKYGSWMGHIRQIKQTQKALNNKRIASEKENCPKPSPSILEWLKSNAPSTPRGP